MLDDHDEKLRELHYRENYQEEHILDEHRSYGSFMQRKKQMMEDNRKVFLDMHYQFTFKSKRTRMNHIRHFKDDLPIFSKKKDFIEAYRNRQVIIFKSNAGSGKSTQLPQYLLDCAEGRVLITEPRVIAAENVARRVQEELMDEENKHDQTVGYVSGPTYKIHRSATQIIYLSEVLYTYAA